MLGGVLARGLTHAGITPLDVATHSDNTRARTR